MTRPETEYQKILEYRGHLQNYFHIIIIIIIIRPFIKRVNKDNKPISRLRA